MRSRRNRARKLACMMCGGGGVCGRGEVRCGELGLCIGGARGAARWDGPWRGMVAGHGALARRGRDGGLVEG